MTGTFRYANTWPTAIALVAPAGWTWTGWSPGTTALADAEASLTVGREDPGSVKVMVHPTG